MEISFTQEQITLMIKQQQKQAAESRKLVEGFRRQALKEPGEWITFPIVFWRNLYLEIDELLEDDDSTELTNWVMARAAEYLDLVVKRDTWKGFKFRLENDRVSIQYNSI